MENSRPGTDLPDLQRQDRLFDQWQHIGGQDVHWNGKDHQAAQYQPDQDDQQGEKIKINFWFGYVRPGDRNGSSKVCLQRGK